MLNQSKTAVQSLATICHGRRCIYILPWRSAAYGAASLAIVLAVLLAVDRFVLGSIESRGWTAGERWARHNKLVELNHRRKTTTDQCQLREWSGQPLAEHPPGGRRILVLGDSFVWGPPYLTLNHLWWRQLAIELKRRGYRDVEVVAAGHPGWSTRQQLACARRLIPEVKPDIVIWGYVTNDPDEKLVPQIFDLQDRFPLGQRARVGLSRLFPSLMFKFESLRNQKLAQQYSGPEYGYAYHDWELQLVQGENLERYKETVASVSELLRERALPTFLMTLPSWPSREYFRVRYAPVLPLWEEAGIPVHNTLDAFVARYGNAPEKGPEAILWGINPADSHPGPRATHFHAVMAADYLESHWPQLLGSQDASRPHELAINDWLPYDLDVRPIDEQTFELTYPATEETLLRLPGEEPSVLVALRYPLPLGELRLEGPALASARVWVSLLDPAEQYDPVEWREVGSFHGSEPGRAWFAHVTPPELAHRPVSLIRFHADIRGADRRLTLRLVHRPRDLERR